MAYKFKDSKVKIIPINVYFDDELFNALKLISYFENTNKSKVFNTFIKKGGDYEAYKKNLHRKKCKNKAKKRRQETRYFTKCLPYFEYEAYD